MVEKVTIVHNKETGFRYFLVGESMILDKAGDLAREDAYVLKDVDDGRLVTVKQTSFKHDFKVIFSNDQQYEQL